MQADGTRLLCVVAARACACAECFDGFRAILPDCIDKERGLISAGKNGKGRR